MSKEPELKARDKVVLRMTREGAVEENLTAGTEQRTSERLEDAGLVKPVETAAPSDALSPEEQKKVQMRRQQRQFQAKHAKDNDTQPLSETSATEEKQPENPPQNAPDSRAADVVSEESCHPSKRLYRLERRSAQAHDRLDKACKTLTKRKGFREERIFDETTVRGKTQLQFEEVLEQKPPCKLSFTASEAVHMTGNTLAFGIHGKIHEVEQENAAVEAMHKSEIAAETAARHSVRSSHHSDRLQKKISKLEHDAQKADAQLHYEKFSQEHPNLNKHYQKQRLKKEYAAARRTGAQTAGASTVDTGKRTGEKVSEKLKDFAANNKKAFLWITVLTAALIFLATGVSSCTAMFSSAGSAVIASSYLSEDDAMLGAEAQYCQMEQELQRYLDTYESAHNYDEYHFDLDDIEHDPYVLISILSALHEGEFTLDEVQGTLQMLFEKQYILTEEVIVETRYRTETDTWTDADGNTHTETYRVPYDYYICNVKLENFNLSHVPVYIMSQEQLSMYATYMSVLGNREDLFGNSPYVDKYITNPPADYDVNPEYLNDEKFATLITEAEKYLGYLYVWGGSNPDTSFDCSGFVSYVLTNSGLVNTGRLGAQGLYNVCTPVSKANAQPGDLIFFVGTYDTPGVSHVGIYVGDGVMIHCGDPIQYTSINSSYWQQHFYAFGRPAY